MHIYMYCKTSQWLPSSAWYLDVNDRFKIWYNTQSYFFTINNTSKCISVCITRSPIFGKYVLDILGLIIATKLGTILKVPSHGQTIILLLSILKKQKCVEHVTKSECIFACIARSHDVKMRSFMDNINLHSHVQPYSQYQKQSICPFRSNKQNIKYFTYAKLKETKQNISDKNTNITWFLNKTYIVNILVTCSRMRNFRRNVMLTWRHYKLNSQAKEIHDIFLNFAE